MMSQITIGGSSERKPSTGSCAECRRSKLRCDRVFPCQTCIRRGCGDLCPYGTMAATKGNRVLMAHAQQLEKQVKGMQSRIEELESALKAQSNGNDLHPLVQGSLDHAGLLTFEDDIDEATDAVDALSLGAGGQARYHGLTASSETLQGLIHPPTGDSDPDISNPQYLDLNPELIELFNAFPMGLTHRIFNKSYFNEYMPTREHAIALIDRYYVHFCLWEPIRQQDVFENILGPIYTSAVRPSAESVHAHQLSLFFILLASAGIHDKNPSSVFQRQQYHALARAAFSLEPIAREVTTASTQALFIIIWYLHLSDANSIEERWLLGGVCAKTAQTLGLQRDSACWGLDENEIQRRRCTFWEFYSYDGWNSILTGRPPSMSISHTDCRFPKDLGAVTNSLGETELSYQAFKFRHDACCLSLVVQYAFSTKPTPYNALLELDKKLGQFAVPSHLRAPRDASEGDRVWSADSARANQQYCVIHMQESIAMYIHRCYFAQAIRAEPLDPLKHRFAHSVLVVYTSASRLIYGLTGLYALHPDLTSRQSFFWSSVFSSCIVLGALVVESPGCSLSRNGLSEMQQAITLYEVGSRTCRPSNAMNVLERLFNRAQAAFAEFYSLSPQNLTVRHNCREPDELAVLGGHKFVMRLSDSRTRDQLPFTTTSLRSSGPHEEKYPDTKSYIAGPSYALHSRRDVASTFVGDRARYEQLPTRPVFKISPSPDRDFLQSGVYIQNPMQSQGHSHPDQMDDTLVVPEGQNQNDLWHSFLSGLLPSPGIPAQPPSYSRPFNNNTHP